MSVHHRTGIKTIILARGNFQGGVASARVCSLRSFGASQVCDHSYLTAPVIPLALYKWNMRAN